MINVWRAPVFLKGKKLRPWCLNAVMVDHDTPQVCLEPMEPLDSQFSASGEAFGNSPINLDLPLVVASILVGLSPFTPQR